MVRKNMSKMNFLASLSFSSLLKYEVKSS